MIVTKLVANRAVENVDCGGDENPASRADVGLGAATTDGIVICHIDVEHELTLNWFEGGRPHGFLISWLQTSRVCYRKPDRWEATRLTLALYTGPISNLVGLRVHTCFFSSSALGKELYRRYTSPWRVNANSRLTKRLVGAGSWLSQWNMDLKGYKR